MARKHQELLVWQEAMELVRAVYKVTMSFPQNETYGLTSQMRRAAVSIPSNISEGAARNGDREFMQFLYIARGSLSELETQLLIAGELGYLRETGPIQGRIDKIFGLIGGLLKSIQKRNSR